MHPLEAGDGTDRALVESVGKSVWLLVRKRVKLAHCMKEAGTCNLAGPLQSTSMARC